MDPREVEVCVRYPPRSAVMVSAVLAAATFPAALRMPADAAGGAHQGHAAARERAAELTPAQAAAGRHRRAPWRLAAVVHTGAAGNLSGYTSVLALSRSDAWAFGGTNPGGPSAPIAAHWDGRRWRAVALPPGLTGFIRAASASSPRSIWAVNYFGSYLLHWNGRHWTVGRRWRGSQTATSVVAISRSDVWAFGAGSKPQAWQYNGTSWRRRHGPAATVVQASAHGRDSIWAIAQGRRGREIVRYDDGRWTRVRVGAALAKMTLADILAVSRSSVWVSGTTASGSGLIVAHRDGGRWRRFTAPWPVRPERFAADGHGGIWIPTVTGTLTSTRWVLHLSPSGRWTRTSFAAGPGSSVGDLALIPGTRSLWASGGLLRGTSGDAAVWAHGRVPVRGAPRRLGASRRRDAGRSSASRPGPRIYPLR